MKIKLLSIFVCYFIMFSSHEAHSQANRLAFGFQYKPIIPTNIFGAGRQELTEGPFNVLVKQKYGNVIGGIVRIGLNNFISLETGINFVQRNYSTEYSVPDSSVSIMNDFKVVSYEIPVNALVYIKLSKQIYMNVALGVSACIFPSNISTVTARDEIPRTSFVMEGLRTSLVQGGLNSNVGFEWRTEKIGYFYIGASYFLPFTPIMSNSFNYKYDGINNHLIYSKLNGTYLTVDIRYFFKENKAKYNKWNEERMEYRKEQKSKRDTRKKLKTARKKRESTK